MVDVIKKNDRVIVVRVDVCWWKNGKRKTETKVKGCDGKWYEKVGGKLKKCGSGSVGLGRLTSNS